MSGVYIERDNRNLVDISPTQTKRLIEIVNGPNNPINIGGLLSGIVWDWFVVSYPSATTEIYTFMSGGSSGTVVKTIQIDYTNATKQFMAEGGAI